ncbi:hypothetical protein BCR32DRAFT_298498 [Anaeromyces robustus]|uniref:Transcription regulator Rua1 C-terminal domain-containing protein n=1 Tax=Anaeromyces robustus TaxID=1754192 RepID=A0A1Y1VPL7_9FUNG|nr:hypothetical protein BCR32DRAFT_298498 [Anaeromyces robustus]|eukprot:ORX63252.1 hypothetical protein BCR32DRAFT_298498 [Anaeromyces robustus]
MQRKVFCDQCNPGRWLQLKNSAYWYHKQFFHGISSVSGKPFHPPLATKVLDYKEMLEIVNESESKNIKDNLLGNKRNKKENSTSNNSTNTTSSSNDKEKDDLSIITSNEEFLKAFKDLVAESTINLPEGFNLNDCILKFVVGLCHHCNEWVPLMINKKRSSQFFTNILKYKQNDKFLIEKSKKNGKPLNKYYLKKKYNMYNDKKNITEIIISYLQQVKQNKKEINDIINNNGMTILWYRHAHKCHQYLRPKLNIDDYSSKNETSTNTTTTSTTNNTTTTNTTNNTTTTNTTTISTTSTITNESSIVTSTIKETGLASLNNIKPETSIESNNIGNINSTVYNHTVLPMTTSINPIYDAITTNTNTNTYTTTSNTQIIPTTIINNNTTQTYSNNCSSYVINSNNKRLLSNDISIYDDYRQNKKEKLI